jgi:hypothetical protein
MLCFQRPAHLFQARHHARTTQLIFDKDEQATAVAKRWVAGGIFSLEIPADAETLVSGGTDFLTKAFRASGRTSGQQQGQSYSCGERIPRGRHRQEIVADRGIRTARAGVTRTAVYQVFAEFRQRAVGPGALHDDLGSVWSPQKAG